jgi:hypothetical protein
MAKKKNISKKHKFKHVEQGTAVSSSISSANTAAATITTAKGPVTRKPVFVNQAVTRDFSYVVTDVRRIAVLAVSLVVLELVLAYVFSHTSIGPAIYKMVGV